MSTSIPKPDTVTLVLAEKAANILLLGVPVQDEFRRHLQFFQSLNVRHFFVACEKDPSLKFFEENGISVHSIEWEDGNSPPPNVVEEFLSVFYSSDRKENDFIAVACKRGYGRAPTLAAISLIENGMKPLSALTFLRQKNPRFITERQKSFILEYKPQKKGKKCRIA